MLKFKATFKPDTSIHLGDWGEDTSFRSGAGFKDNAGEIIDDLTKGVDFIEEYEPDLIFNGNHDIRVLESLNDPNAHRRYAAQEIVKRVKHVLGKNTDFEETYDIRKSVRVLGDTKFLHGFMYSENGVRDHAAHFGKCVIAHLHKVSSVPANRYDGPVGYCVGYLGNAAKFEYASRRRAVSQWSQGFAWGEYSDKECIVYLAERPKVGEWRMPL